MIVTCNRPAKYVAIQLVSSLSSSGRSRDHVGDARRARHYLTIQPVSHRSSSGHTTGILTYSDEESSQTVGDDRGARFVLHFVVARLHSVGTGR